MRVDHQQHVFLNLANGLDAELAIGTAIILPFQHRPGEDEDRAIKAKTSLPQGFLVLRAVPFELHRRIVRL